MTRGVLTTVAVFAICMLVTVAGFFLLDVEHIALNFCALGALLFSFLVSMISMVTIIGPKANKDGFFYSGAIGALISVYQILVIISVIFTKFFIERLNTFVFLQVGINALFFILAIIIIYISGQVKAKNEMTKEKYESGDHDKPKRGGF